MTPNPEQLEQLIPPMVREFVKAQVAALRTEQVEQAREIGTQLAEVAQLKALMSELANQLRQLERRYEEHDRKSLTRRNLMAALNDLGVDTNVAG
jgi:ATP-dependent protease HslVU (ClpYQ) ATPase subunit